MCNCIQLGDYVCCPKDKLQDKCIEVGNYICCPREKHCGKPCENYRNCSNYNQSNSCRNAGATKCCGCARSRSAEPQPRFVEEKFSNRITPSFLCKDPPKPKVRKPKVCKKMKQKTDACCCVPTSKANNRQRVSTLMPGIYVPEGVTVTPQAPQVDAEGAGQPEQQPANSNPDMAPTPNPTNYIPGQGTTANTTPGLVPGYLPGSAGYPANQNIQGYAPTIPGYQYPVVGPFAPTLFLPPQIPQGPVANPNQSGYGQYAPIGGQPAAGLPSCRQPPFDPCTGEECNPERCLIRRSKSETPANRAINGLGVDHTSQRHHQPSHIEGTLQGEEQSVKNLDLPPMFNCCCHCSLSSDLIERICKSLQISSCIQNCCCGNCPKMSGPRKTPANIPFSKRKPKPSRSSISQMAENGGKRDIQVEKNINHKLAAGPTGRTGSIADSIYSGGRSNIKSGQELTAALGASPTPSAPAVPASFGSSCCGCKEHCTSVAKPPTTRTCSCNANLGRSDDSTQTPPPERNEGTKQRDQAGPCDQSPCCRVGSACVSSGANSTCATCCKAGCGSCCSNSCCGNSYCWPYYYYYDPCTGMYYCYRNCCYGYRNSCCNSCNSCNTTSCCQPNVKCCKAGGKRCEKDLIYPSAGNAAKRKENKSSPARKTHPDRNMGGDAMVPFRPEMQDLYEQWVNFQQYIKQYPQAASLNPIPAIVPGLTANRNGYYATTAMSAPFYFASSYHNQMNMNPSGNCCSPPMQFPNMPNQQAQPKQPETDIDWTPQ